MADDEAEPMEQFYVAAGLRPDGSRKLGLAWESSAAGRFYYPVAHLDHAGLSIPMHRLDAARERLGLGPSPVSQDQWRKMIGCGSADEEAARMRKGRDARTPSDVEEGEDAAGS